jgi:ribonuclease J
LVVTIGINAHKSSLAVALKVAHASGHASISDLRRVADAFADARLVPIHTAHPEQFADAFGRAEIHADGEWWAV